MNKDWYKSKTVWTAAVAFALAIASAMGVDIPVEVYTALGAFGLYSVRDAIN